MLTDECYRMLPRLSPKSCLSTFEPKSLPCLRWCGGDRDTQAFTVGQAGKPEGTCPIGCSWLAGWSRGREESRMVLALLGEAGKRATVCLTLSFRAP